MADDQDKIPRIVLLPGAQAQVDADPELAKALRALHEPLLNAMQGVSDGRYKSFEDAVEAMTGSRPTAAQPPHPPRHGYYLSVDKNKKGPGYIAVITDGHPRYGHDPIEILDMETFSAKADAKPWFRQRCLELPWRKDDDSPDAT